MNCSSLFLFVGITHSFVYAYNQLCIQEYEITVWDVDVCILWLIAVFVPWRDNRSHVDSYAVLRLQSVTLVL